MPAVSVPSNPDPHETAYLRGGENEVLRISLFHLLQQGYVQVIQGKTGILSESEQIVQRTGKGSGTLSALEREILGKLAGHTASEIYKDEVLLSAVKSHCAPHEQRLKGEHLLAGPDLTDKAWQILWAGGLAVAALGSYKLVAALATGHTNVLFLIGMGVVAVLILNSICSPRLTARGKRYLKDLEAAFGQWKEQASQVAESQLLTLSAVFGIAVLSNTSHDDFQKMFAKGSASGGGCGGGCGSGCGGGCGGCGGCG